MENNELLKAVHDGMQEINDLLTKSGYGDMANADEEPKPEDAPPAPPAEVPNPEEKPAEDLGEMKEEIAEQANPEAPPAPPAEGEAPDARAELAAETKSLNDEELAMMLEIFMAEKEARGAANPEAAPPPPAAAPEAPPALPVEGAEKSMKDDFAKMTKSMSDVIDALGKLTKEVEAIKVTPKKPATSTKPAVTNSVQVLEKSTPAKADEKRLSKSETIDFLVNEIRNSNGRVNKSMVLDAHYVQDGKELCDFQDSLTKIGVQFPKL